MQQPIPCTASRAPIGTGKTQSKIIRRAHVEVVNHQNLLEQISVKSWSLCCLQFRAACKWGLGCPSCLSPYWHPLTVSHIGTTLAPDPCTYVWPPATEYCLLMVDSDDTRTDTRLENVWDCVWSAFPWSTVWTNKILSFDRSSGSSCLWATPNRRLARSHSLILSTVYWRYSLYY